MEREVSHSVELSVGLVALAALLSIIMFTVTIGNIVKAKSGDGLTDVRDSMSVEYVKGLVSGEIDNEMPTATAYNILNKFRGVIVEEATGYDSKVRNLQIEDSILKDNLKGRVQLEIKETTQGTYVAIVRILDKDGTIKSGQVQTGINTLNSKYTYK